MHCLDWSLGLRLRSYFAPIAYICISCDNTRTHIFVLCANIRHKNHAGYNNSTAQFRQNNIFSNNCMVTENRPATYAISQHQCARVYRRALSPTVSKKLPNGVRVCHYTLYATLPLLNNDERIYNVGERNNAVTNRLT